ncbi:hypothetical protein QJ857_gp0286 [Tupanvirus soda lake]|uniref:SCP domain-containing protein n=2 Tax=Tupanvirus TaxID=2094720 RepID=A0A6N1NPD7_9VIRU|nr:hypothetical protein QJ857_gp0286 [Tupanvirus soda lake]QKU35740.1 hypothetical protein [Tupanvirus soda lake]
MYQYQNIYQIPAVSNTISPNQQREAWLQFHNNARLNAGVSPLVWNNQLELDAKNYANRCTFQHSDIAKKALVGENISQGVPFEKYNSIHAIFNGWMSERNNCPSIDPHLIGHYTQIINPRVNEVGCACSRCNYTTGLNPENNALICLCRYDQIQNLDEIYCNKSYPLLSSDAIPLRE